MSKKNEVPARQKEFLETGARLAEAVGIVNVTRRAIAEYHNVTDPLVGKHVGGKAELQAGIKRTMKRLGLKEPDAKTVAEKGIALRARKDIAPLKRNKDGKLATKKVAKKASSAAGKKPSAPSPAAVKSKPAKKSVTKKATVPVTKATRTADKKPAAPKTPADPKKGAPSRKVVKKAPSNKAKFPTKAPPLPALPNLGE